MQQTVLVFGANGKLGTHVVNQALEKGYKVKAFVRTPEKYALTKGQDVEVVKGDATNITDVKRSMEGADLVVSCLGNPPKKGIYIMEKAHSNISYLDNHLLTVSWFSPTSLRYCVQVICRC